MKRILGILLLLVFASVSAQAALIDRGGGFIYDSDQDITWTQNANINGQEFWDYQVAWAAGLSIYDSVRDVTWSDWRLASMDVNGDDTIIDCSSATELACRDNEYGYLFEQYGVSSSTPGLFTNVQLGNYWSGTEVYAPSSLARPRAWNFTFGNGSQGWSNQGDYLYGWAVRPGDVSAVPVPAAVWLFGSALMGLLGMRRVRR